jgi:hypothetical protein
MRSSSGDEVRWVEDASIASNYGARIDISAPAKDLAYPDGQGNSITATSFAAPLVAGAAALLMSSDPTLSATEVRERLKEGSAPMPGVAGMGDGFLDVFEALTNAGFERDGGRSLSWDESGSWNERDFVRAETWVTPLSYFIADGTRHLAAMESQLGDIEPSSGDWMAVIPNGTTAYTGTPGFDGSSSTVYETGFLGINFVILDLGEGGQLPMSFDWALVAALDPSDIPCMGGPVSINDCVAFTSGEPLYLLGGSGPNALFAESYGTTTPLSFKINLFPEISTTASLPLSPHPSTGNGWQRFGDSYAAVPGEPTTLTFINSPVGYRIKPDPDSDVTNPDWITELTNFSLLIDNLEFRSEN